MIFFIIAFTIGVTTLTFSEPKIQKETSEEIHQRVLNERGSK